MSAAIRFVRLPDVALDLVTRQMCDPRVAAHLPLLKDPWDDAASRRLVAAKEARWARDGLGHWAILADGRYAGWGGFEREDDGWDYGLVLTPAHFGLGLRITREALAFARRNPRISRITFLLPPSRERVRALDRLGAAYVGDIDHAGARFRKYALHTP